MKRPMYGKKRIATMVSRLAKQIDADHKYLFKDKELLLVGVLQGALHFVSDLSRAVKTPHTVGYIFASSYEGEKSTGRVRIDWISGHVNRDLSDVHVILVDEIVDTGVTLQTLDALLSRSHRAKPSHVRYCALLQRRDLVQSCNFVGEHIPGDEFLIGYGLDDNQALRHLPYITTK